MKNVRKLVAVGAMITLVGATSLTAFAASGFSTPAGVMTQERADEITAEMLANQEECDGTGTGNDGSVVEKLKIIVELS